MRPLILRPSRGVSRRTGKRDAGYLLRARNSRFLPGDDAGRIWALGGRDAFNDVMIPPAADPAQDDDDSKSLFPFYIDGGTSRICHHRGGSIWEADLGANGALVEVFAISTNEPTPRGIPAAYKDNVYYPVGADAWSSDRHFIVRTRTGWRLGGHRPIAYPFSASPVGAGTFGSSTDLQYTIRIYDSTTDTESLHGLVVTVPAFPAAFAGVAVNFDEGLTVTALGTHLRIYRSLRDEPAGTLYRVDGLDNGIPLATVVPGYTFTDTAENDESQVNGTVRADGEEGTIAWAEHGGPPPQARGAIIFDGSLVLYGIPDRPQDVIYSAPGYPEAFPVDFEGAYQYYLTMSSHKQDTVQVCLPAGPFLLVFGKQAIFRLSHLPTYFEPGFDRRIQDLLTSEHGVVGPYAADNFGIGGEDSEEQAQFVVYVSREHGPMLTNGTYSDPILPQLAWSSLVDPAFLEQVVVRNYSTMKEAWVCYTPPGGTRNTQAVIIDYSVMGKEGGKLRVTWPVDVRFDDAGLGHGNDGVARWYLVAANEATIYVQDQGDKDEQRNTNDAGDIVLEWHFPRRMAFGSATMMDMGRGFLYGQSGIEREFTVRLIALDGRDESTLVETALLGPGETSDAFGVDLQTQGLQVRVEFTGQGWSTYDEREAACAPCLELVELELVGASAQTRTRDQ